MAISAGRIAAAAVSFVAVGLVISYALTMRGGDRFADCRRGAVAGGSATIGGPFTLVDQDGRTVTDREVIAGPALVYFGYTFCPDVCPLDMARNAEAVDALEEMGHSVTPVFISVDPRRDTPDILKDYAAQLHPRLVALTGSADQTRAAAAAYRAYFNSHDIGDDFYLVDHSTQTYLMSPEQGFLEYFNRDVPAEELAERAACFLEAAG